MRHDLRDPNRVPNLEKQTWRKCRKYVVGVPARRGADLFSSLAQMPFDMDLRLYVDLIRYPFVNHSDGRWLTSALLVTSQVPNALGFFYEWLVRLHGSR